MRRGAPPGAAPGGPGLRLPGARPRLRTLVGQRQRGRHPLAELTAGRKAMTGGSAPGSAGGRSGPACPPAARRAACRSSGRGATRPRSSARPRSRRAPRPRVGPAGRGSPCRTRSRRPPRVWPGPRRSPSQARADRLRAARRARRRPRQRWTTRPACPHAVEELAYRQPRAASAVATPAASPGLPAEHAHQHRRGVAPERVGQSDRGALDLAASRLAAKLGRDLGDLGRARRADRVALGLEPAGRVDRDPARRGSSRPSRPRSLPCPARQSPSPSVATISAIVKQSCSSTTSTSRGPMPAWR